MIKPYILRRIKADVLNLPPKVSLVPRLTNRDDDIGYHVLALISGYQVEIIVPISLTPLQKHVYKGILERNAEILKAITAARRKKIAKNTETPTKTISSPS